MNNNFPQSILARSLYKEFGGTAPTSMSWYMQGRREGGGQLGHFTLGHTLLGAPKGYQHNMLRIKEHAPFLSHWLEALAYIYHDSTDNSHTVDINSTIMLHL